MIQNQLSKFEVRIVTAHVKDLDATRFNYRDVRLSTECRIRAGSRPGGLGFSGRETDVAGFRPSPRQCAAGAGWPGRSSYI